MFSISVARIKSIEILMSNLDEGGKDITSILKNSRLKKNQRKYINETLKELKKFSLVEGRKVEGKKVWMLNEKGIKFYKSFFQE